MDKDIIMDAGYFLTHSGLLAERADELLQLQQTCIQHLSAFPPCLQRAGELTLQRLAGYWQGIDWIQPFVLSAVWFIPQASRQKIALANALIAMYAHIQRESLDNVSRQDNDLLPLGSLMYTRSLRQYQQLFPAESHFWQLLEGYYLEWTEAVLWERQRKWGAVKRYSREDALRLAGMRALLKIGSAAVSLLAGKQRFIMPLSSALDQVHVAIQLADGIINWREDLRARRATYFLTEIALALNTRGMAGLGRVDIESFLQTSSLAAKSTKRALGHLSAAKKITARLDAPALVGYIENLNTILREIPRRSGYGLFNSHAVLEHTPATV